MGGLNVALNELNWRSDSCKVLCNTHEPYIVARAHSQLRLCATGYKGSLVIHSLLISTNIQLL